MHLVFCLGAVDKIVELKFADKTAWRGAATGGRIFLDRPELFGGNQREGGVSGYIDVEMGLPDQGQNDYLASNLGANIPAWRGVMALVFRNFYLGNNPYLKKPSVKIQRVFTTPDGQKNWLPEIAGIGNVVSVSDAAIYIAMDGSGSMSGARMAAQKAAVVGLLELIRDNFDEKNDIKIVMWGSISVFSTEQRNCSKDDYADLIDWVQAAPEFTGATDFNAAVAGAKQFFDGDQTVTPWGLGSGFPQNGRFLFNWADGDRGSETKRRVFVFITDGEPTPTTTAQEAADTLRAIDDLEVYGINIALADTQYTALLDNTPGDGVPVVDAGNTDALLDVFKRVFSNGLDYNPAHFLRDVILYPNIGTSDLAANIGDSFETAANTLYDEGFGISLKFQNPRSRRENKAEIERHIDARVYRDRLTGKWEIKLIRKDYDPDNLFVINADNAISWSNFSWRDPKNLPNHIVLKYTDPKEDKLVAIPLVNPAKVQLAGRIISEPVTYDGVRNHDLAARLAARDLLALSSPLRSGTVMVFDLPAELNIGSPIILDNPKQGIASAVYRIVDLKEGDGRSNEIEISVVEEVFALGDEVLTALPSEVPSVASTEALPVVDRLIEEAPYSEIVRTMGQAAADDLLADEPATGFLNLAGKSPSGNALNAVISVDSGAGYEGGNLLQFALALDLLSTLKASADAIVILVDLDADVQDIRIGSLASIGDEYVRIDSVQVYSDAFALPDAFAVNDAFATAATITLGRGCLDTVPQAHAIGETVFFWSDLPASDRVEYFGGETVDVKLRTATGAELLSQSDAPSDTVAFAQRAIRPYPPGNLQIDGNYSVVLVSGVFSLTWAHRDRLIQTTGVYEDHTYGNIGPEASVTYRFVAEMLDQSGVVIQVLEDTSLGSVTSHSFDTSILFDAFAPVDAFAVSDVFLSSAKYLKTSVFSERDGYESWQSASITTPILFAPTNLTMTEIFS
ncbi:MAG: hypothetical protein COA84_15070 [Robiginitomaculum sp.]|nr:MAG: hypothetical protein COA84_15070 [Robiginitomaculum sp.]